MHNGTKAGLLLLLSLAIELSASETEVYVGRPPGVIKFVYLEFPRKLWSYGWNGKGRFLLKINAKTGEVAEVKARFLAQS